MQSSNGQLLPQAEGTKPKRHTAKLVPFAIRKRIINALANGDSIRSISRTLRVSNNTIVAIREEDWQQVAARKQRIAAQAELNATLAAERITDQLQSTKQIPLNILVPVFGVSADKLLQLRGDASLTARHEHTHSHQVELINSFNAAIERAEKRAKAAVVEVQVLPAETGNHSRRTPSKKKANGATD